jgi:hypothetical protein
LFESITGHKEPKNLSRKGIMHYVPIGPTTTPTHVHHLRWELHSYAEHPWQQQRRRHRTLQIWDCTNLEAIIEVLNLSAVALDWGRVLFTGIFPAPSLSFSHKVDLFTGQRPLIRLM